MVHNVDGDLLISDGGVVPSDDPIDGVVSGSRIDGDVVPSDSPKEYIEL